MKDRTGNIIISVALLVGVTAPGFISTYVSAAQVTAKSIALSSSSADADNVTYTVNFTAATAAGAFVIDFCSDSPTIGTACAAPAGFDATGATSTNGSFTAAGDTSQVILTGSIAASDDVSVPLTGINNPTAAGPLYARIVTYDNPTSAAAYTSTDLKTGSKDSGAVVISITNTVGVSGAVLESMTFCVSGNDITSATCSDATSPILKLGETVGSTVALVPGTISTGNLYTLISTNAATGAVVNLKSSTIGCGGLVRAGAANCDIAPATTPGILTTEAKFGVKAVSATGLTGANGTFEVDPESIYNGTDYAMHWVDGDATGVTSTYGDPFLDTAGKPVNGQKMTLTFGAGVTNQTPAGLYSADLGLIATGKF